MLKKTTLAAVAAGLGFLLAMTPLAATAVGANIEGVLVDTTVNELPAPAVAMAADGSSLVVWQDDAPDTPDTTCDGSGGSCEILAAVVGADGETVGEPFVVSGDISVDFYYAAPAVTFNPDTNEWIVLFTSYESGQNGIYVQRVSMDGAFVGSQVALPMTDLTTAADRDTIVSVPAAHDPVQVSATWSSADQAYLVTWLENGNFTSLSGPNGRADFGYFMTADLESADGVDAAFMLSEGNQAAHYSLVKQAYSDTLDEWAFIWTYNNLRTAMRVTTLSLSGTDITVNASFVGASGADENYYDEMMVGDIVWVSTLNSWVLSWDAQLENEGPWNAFARTIATDGTLGDAVQVSDFGDTRFGAPVSWMSSHQLYFDESTGIIYASGHVDSYDEVTNDTQLTAALWTFDAATFEPLGWNELIAPATHVVDDEEVTSMIASSRPKVTGFDGRVAVVYQNWPFGGYEDPAEVRYDLVVGTAPTPTPTPTPTNEALAATGSGNTAGMLALASLIVGAGVTTMLVTRRREQRG